jgi:PPOX class probable F420-dependent enzyme
MDAPRRSILDALEREPVVWLSTTRPDGGPHVVPLWFLWDGRSIVAFSKPHAQKVRNLRADPRAMVAVGRAGATLDVELIEAVAELPGPTDTLPGCFATKYVDLAAEAGVTLDRFATVYTQPIVLHPLRWLGWGGPGRSPAGRQAAMV